MPTPPRFQNIALAFISLPLFLLSSTSITDGKLSSSVNDSQKSEITQHEFGAANRFKRYGYSGSWKTVNSCGYCQQIRQQPTYYPPAPPAPPPPPPPIPAPTYHHHHNRQHFRVHVRVHNYGPSGGYGGAGGGGYGGAGGGGGYGGTGGGSGR